MSRYVYEYPRTADDDWDDAAYYAALAEIQYVTTVGGFVDECTICGQDIDDHTGLCRTHTAWADAEPYGLYDRPRDFQREPWAS